MSSIWAVCFFNAKYSNWGLWDFIIYSCQQSWGRCYHYSHFTEEKIEGQITELSNAKTKRHKTRPSQTPEPRPLNTIPHCLPLRPGIKTWGIKPYINYHQNKTIPIPLPSRSMWFPKTPHISRQWEHTHI